MRKNIIVLAVVVLIISCLIYVYSTLSKPEGYQKQPTSKLKNIERNPVTIVVPDDHSTIQKAIFSAKAADIVFVKKGVYKETIILRNGVKLIGEDRDGVIIKNNANDLQHVILADCPNGLIENLTVEQFGDYEAEAKPAGIFIVNSSVDVNGCRIKNISGSGIIVKGNSSPVISNCIIESNGSNGIQVVKAASPTIKDNMIRNNKLSGIYLAEKSAGTIESNICEQNNSGILVMDKDTDALVKNNHCRDNEEYGIYIRDGANIVAEGNICEKNGKSGIVVYHQGTTATLNGNRCIKNKNYGIFFSEGSKSTAEKNICEVNGKTGIIVSGEGAVATLRNNECSYNSANGIRVVDKADALVEGNICNENAKNGISVDGAGVEPELKKNQCFENKVNGIYFGSGAWGTAEENICKNNKWNGISVEDIQSLPTLKNNQCTGNKGHDFYYYQGEVGRVKQLLLEENFDKLEEVAEQFRTERTISQGGNWRLSWFYGGLSKGWIGFTPSKKDLALQKLQRWIEQKPNSVTPRIVLGRVYTDFGWEARGSGWAKDVTEEGWEIFHEELAKAWDILLEAEKLEQKDPELYCALMLIARGTSKPDELVVGFFEKGVAIDSGHHPLYTERAETLLPRWGGGQGELEKFADRAVELTQEEEGQSNYLRIAAKAASYHYSDGPEEFLKHNFSYHRLTQAYHDLIQHYPNTNYYINTFGFMASVYGDKETARTIFDEIGRNVDYSAWGGSDNYNKYHKWVYGYSGAEKAEEGKYDIDKAARLHASDDSEKKDIGLERKALAEKGLTPESLKDFEEYLEANPTDIDMRKQLLSYYFENRYQNEKAAKASEKHILWIIKNKPDSDVAGQSDMMLDPILHKEAYNTAKEMWLEHIKKYEENSHILGNAGNFFLLHDDDIAEKCFKKAQYFEPKNSKWSEQLGNLYRLKMFTTPKNEQVSIAKKALEQFEISLKNAKGDTERFYKLGSVAKMAFEADDMDKARTYAKELLDKTANYEDDWNYGNAIHHGNLILGRIALRLGDLDKAKEHLIKAGQTPGSPQLNSFGPNMLLAKELLEKGESDVVLKYFQSCGKFWIMNNGKLDKWADTVKSGKIPYFEGNLRY